MTIKHGSTQYKIKLMTNSSQKDRKAHAKEILKEQRAFRESLVNVRRMRGLSQARVAEILGQSQSSIAQFERYDSNPTLGSIRRYALAVGASVSMTAEMRRSTYAAPGHAASKPMKVVKATSGRQLGQVAWERPTIEEEYA